MSVLGLCLQINDCLFAWISLVALSLTYFIRPSACSDMEEYKFCMFGHGRIKILWYSGMTTLKVPSWFFCETGVLSFDGVGFFRISKSSSTSPESHLASSRHRGFFECNTMVDVCLSASVRMIYNERNSSCMSYCWCTIKLILHRFICNMLLNTYNI